MNQTPPAATLPRGMTEQMVRRTIRLSYAQAMHVVEEFQRMLPDWLPAGRGADDEAAK